MLNSLRSELPKGHANPKNAGESDPADAATDELNYGADHPHFSIMAINLVRHN